MFNTLNMQKFHFKKFTGATKRPGPPSMCAPGHHRTLRPASGVDIPGVVYGWLLASFFSRSVCGFTPAQSIVKYSW